MSSVAARGELKRALVPAPSRVPEVTVASGPTPASVVQTPAGVMKRMLEFVCGATQGWVDESGVCVG
jgi:hypothetical protein